MAKDEDEGQSRGFKVQDRRRFVDPEPGDRAEEPAAPKSPGERYTRSDASFAAVDEAAAHVHTHGATSAAGAAPSGTDAVAPESTAAGEAVFGEMSFSTFIMGLTTQALMHLGEIPDPAHQNLAHDLPAAKQMIDLLGVLRDKTKGNLDAAEEQLLGEVLYDLRMRYVEMARGR
jgi:hypothetical protein